MKQVLVIGAGGQLGRELADIQQAYPGVQLHLSGHAELDITSADSITNGLSVDDLAYVINCSAYTAVDKAESEAESAFAVNETGPRLLAEACKSKSIKLVHVSTDFVFDGQLSRPYNETDSTNPLGVYGTSKHAGEIAVQDADETAVILRTAWLYSSFGGNFVKTMRRLGSERDNLNVIYDQIGSPTYARDLAKDILTAIDNGKMDTANGIYHYTNEGIASWYDFAVAIMRLSGISCNVQPIRTEEYPTPAKRPAYGILDKKKFKTHFETQLPHWYDSLAACINKLATDE